ncbi:MAG: hypothetical protein DRP94_07465 [Candidatus Latescibacterota bacterium]|nr:MAG: hypothetical protein DRP94_07465 [Candidatus Latescibacterota bacterium]
MRLLIVTQADPLYMPVFFKFFTENLRNPEVEVRKVIILRPLNQKDKFGLLKKVLDLYGAWGTFRLLLRILRVKVGTGTVEGYLKRAGIGYEYVEDINDGSVADYVRREGIDLIVSVAASQMFSRKLLSSPRYGCINVHHGKLPEYRGMMSNFWQMYNGEEFAVVTFHRMTEDLDGGEVLLEKKVKINYDRPLDYLIKKTKIFSALYMLDLLDEIAEDPGRLLQGRPQEGRKGYYSFPGKEHRIAFRRKGLKLL